MQQKVNWNQDDIKKNIFLGDMKTLIKELGEIKSGYKERIREEVDRAVEKVIGEKINMIEGLLKEVIVQKKIFMDKGFITREEINKKYEELRKEAIESQKKK